MTRTTPTQCFNHTHCNLKQKVEVIKTVQKNPGMNSRTLGEMFDCGKTQIGKILKQKDSLLSMYESNASGSRVHTNKLLLYQNMKKSINPLYEWYTLACYKNIFPMQPHLAEMAREIADRTA